MFSNRWKRRYLGGAENGGMNYNSRIEGIIFLKGVEVSASQSNEKRQRKSVQNDAMAGKLWSSTCDCASSTDVFGHKLSGTCRWPLTLPATTSH